ncbi:MAG TPA: vWA domain-containing protein, partial [Polyangia bacterium]|nr:vWA domain-containing protein [Polyangia bacterium]
GGIDNSPDAMSCGSADFGLQRVPADVVIVLDRSGSMNDPPPGGGASKWQQVTSAINQTVGTLQNSIRWGLKFFPSDDMCGVAGGVDVQVSDTSYMQVPGAIGGQAPGGGTPTTNAIQTAGQYLAGVQGTNPKYLLLATDGQPNCGGGCGCPPGTTMMGTQCCIQTICVPCSAGLGPDDQNAIQAVGAVAGMGIHTFVIGIATDTMADATLNQMAQNGMEPRPGGPPSYYPVASQQDLANALMAIAGRIGSCTFPLQMVPPDPNMVRVTADGMIVPRDPTHADGWDFGPGNMSIVFYGSWCNRLQMGMIQNVHAIFGCPPIGILK